MCFLSPFALGIDPASVGSILRALATFFINKKKNMGMKEITRKEVKESKRPIRFHLTLGVKTDPQWPYEATQKKLDMVPRFGLTLDSVLGPCPEIKSRFRLKYMEFKPMDSNTRICNYIKWDIFNVFSCSSVGYIYGCESSNPPCSK